MGQMWGPPKCEPCLFAIVSFFNEIQQMHRKTGSSRLRASGNVKRFTDNPS